MFFVFPFSPHKNPGLHDLVHGGRAGVSDHQPRGGQRGRGGTRPPQATAGRRGREREGVVVGTPEGRGGMGGLKYCRGGRGWVEGDRGEEERVEGGEGATPNRLCWRGGEGGGGRSGGERRSRQHWRRPAPAGFFGHGFKSAWRAVKACVLSRHHARHSNVAIVTLQPIPQRLLVEQHFFV